MLEGLSGTALPREFYEETGKMRFDHEAYRKEGQAYIKRWEKEMDKSFGPDFERKMERFTNPAGMDAKLAATKRAELTQAVKPKTNATNAISIIIFFILSFEIILTNKIKR